MPSRLGASREEIAYEAERTHTAYVQARRQVDELSTLVQVNMVHVPIVRTEADLVQYLKDTIQHRKKRWEMFRAHISSRAKAQFTYLLSERSFRGRLLADHNNKLLDLQVHSKVTSIDSANSD